MKKSLVILASLLFGAMILPSISYAAPSKEKQTKKVEQDEATTRQDAVIFKVHDISPVDEEGVVVGCDFTVTLYNRTAINFRSFTINLNWTDPIDERFKFDRYVEAVMPKDELDKFKDVMTDEASIKPVATSVVVNAFGADKQVSVRSHIKSEKCFLMLSEAQYTVTPCDIARNIEEGNGFAGINQSNECTGLFQYVDTKNPEYYGKFKNVSISEAAKQEEIMQHSELADIDTIIGKIVDNMGVSGNTLTNIN